MRTQFSGIRSRNIEDRGNEIEEAKYFYLLPNRLRSRCLLENQYNETHCRKRTGEALHHVQKFGDLITAAVLSLGKLCEDHGYS